MFKELFLSAVISASAIIKSSNDNSKSHDYEYMFKLEKNEDNISYLIKRNWERELGNKFIDNIFGNIKGKKSYIEEKLLNIKKI